VSSADNIIPFEPKQEAVEPVMSGDDREVIMQTLANVIDFQEKLEKGMQLASRVIAELQSHVRDLEREVAQLKKALPKKPAILNAQGARAN
jgi:hypothetical protein